MVKSKTFKTLGTLASIATIISLILVIITTFFPNLITNATKQAIDFDSQYKKPDGEVRPAVVIAQTNAFFIAAAIIIVFWGLALAGFFYDGTKKSASSVAVGGGRKRGYIVMFIVVGILLLVLGINLPRAIYNPTHMRTLSIYFNLAAWAKNSWLGGCVMGLIGFFFSLGVAAASFSLLVVLPRTLKKKKFQKKLKLH